MSDGEGEVSQPDPIAAWRDRPRSLSLRGVNEVVRRGDALVAALEEAQRERDEARSALALAEKANVMAGIALVPSMDHKYNSCNVGMDEKCFTCQAFTALSEAKKARALAGGASPAAPRELEVSETTTRRVTKHGTVHEMANLGVRSLCGLALPEPWEWTDDLVSCKRCVAIESAGLPDEETPPDD